MRLKSALIGFMCATALLGAFSAQAQFVSSAGGLGVYDPANNVTWTSNANLMATQAATYPRGPAAYVKAVIAASHGMIHFAPNPRDPATNPGTYSLTPGDFNTSTGQMNWYGAQAWVHYLNSINYGGSRQWALPTTVDTSFGASGGASSAFPPAQSSSQLAQLFFGGLGQVGGSSILATHNDNYSLFTNMQKPAYWSGTEFSGFPSNAWYFSNEDGSQSRTPKDTAIYALAVCPGKL